MKVVIAGGGRVGSALASRLSSDKHSVTVIDRDPAVCKRLFEDLGVVTVLGDATDAHSLEQAGMATAEIAAGVLQRDADNLAFVMLARSVSPARLMVRMLDENFRAAYRMAGVRDLVPEAEVVVSKMATAIEFPQVLASLPLAGSSDVILFELLLDARSTVTGKTISEVANTGDFPKECLFIGLIDSKGTVELPSGKTLLRAGHTAILVAHRQHLDAAVEILTAQPAMGEQALGLVTSLRRIDFLSPLSNEELVDLARGIELRRRAAGEVVFRKGDPGESFYLVLSGEITLGEGSNVIERVRAGGFFGEVSLLTGEPRSTSAIAGLDAELAAIPRTEFRRVLMANPAMALDMSRILSQRLASAARADKKKGLFGR